MTTIADIFDLPDHVHQGDFVLRLSEGVERVEQMLRDYMVTEQLARCFDDALSLIGRAVEAHPPDIPDATHLALSPPRAG